MNNKRIDLHVRALVFAVYLAALPVSLDAIPAAVAQDPGHDSWIPWCEHPDGNGGFECHWYRSTSNRSTWDDAELAAVQLGGHLVTITSADENVWLAEHFPFEDTDLDVDYWIGFYQDTSDPTYSEPSGGWKWIGDPDLCRWSAGNPDVCYTSWNLASGEPNDGNQPEGEHFARLSWGPFAQGGWTDHWGPFWFGIVERTDITDKVPTVSTWGLVAMVLVFLAGGTIVLRQRRLAA